MKVLLIDDDAFLASIYSQKFQREGYEVHVVTNGEDGLKAATAMKPDVIVLDLVMPRFDGFTVLERLKADANTKRIPVFVLTNLGQQQDIDRCMKLGAAGYIIKTQSLPDEIVQKVSVVLK
jgi:CheY-like chemotaxis protein